LGKIRAEDFSAYSVLYDPSDSESAAGQGFALEEDGKRNHDLNMD
jgi:hypothetical protein